jgi:7-cyano-7-deazaguanine synthase
MPSKRSQPYDEIAHYPGRETNVQAYYAVWTPYDVTPRPKALLVLSGGQDSSTCALLASCLGWEIHAITFDYGQRHAREIESAKNVAAILGVASHEIIAVPNCMVSTSPLTSNNDLEQYESPEQMDAIIGDRIEKTFVPMRNALFLTIAANRAAALGCKTIWLGVCQNDNANYPDCRRAFLEYAQGYINTALGLERDPIVIHAPLLHLDKSRICQLGYELPQGLEVLAHTHTSYAGDYPPLDQNHATVLRAQGFEEAGIPDPLIVRAWTEGLMPLPSSSNYSGIAEFHQPGAQDAVN